MYKNIDFTADLTPEVSLETVSVVNKNITSKEDNLKKDLENKVIDAIKINNKTLVIKGFNQNIDNSLLNIINLDIKNINEGQSSTTVFDENVDININDEIIVTKIELSDEPIELFDDNNTDITEYEVNKGDTLSSIAKKFNISVETILWANDLTTKSKIKIGQKLVILPVSGISYKVKKGDTISGLAKRFNVKERDIIDFNQTEDNKLIVGENIIIPGGKISNNSKTNPSSANNKNNNKNNNNSSSGLVRPIAGGIKTQGIHGYNGIDIGAPIGTSVFAADAGVVTLIRGGNGWNGGYGNYIVVKHKNGVQTLYAHLDKILVDKGQSVDRGQLIGKSGNTGRSTGPHLHFEVRGARNPF